MAKKLEFRAGIEAFFLRNAWVRALLPLTLAGVVGVLANILVVEITRNNSVDWNLLPKSRSFWYLIIASCLSAAHQICIQRYDRELAKGFTPKQYEASIRNQMAQHVADRCQKLIKAGNIEQLEKESETFRRLYGEKDK